MSKSKQICVRVVIQATVESIHTTVSAAVDAELRVTVLLHPRGLKSVNNYSRNRYGVL